MQDVLGVSILQRQKNLRHRGHAFPGVAPLSPVPNVRPLDSRHYEKWPAFRIQACIDVWHDSAMLNGLQDFDLALKSQRGPPRIYESTGIEALECHVERRNTCLAG